MTAHQSAQRIFGMGVTTLDLINTVDSDPPEDAQLQVTGQRALIANPVTLR
ncbi:hypothetical protein [uncultured Thiodictyon sp.]|uniref:hypothetical protein n=1 Tax=uncultured Thiodictyon sp. TaxID=1846217 RepID=UPI0025DAC2E6|nr:hypothetical protein [uncultured Thiodictyon sp.]